MLLVIRSFAKRGVVKGDKSFVDDRRFALVAARGEGLKMELADRIYHTTVPLPHGSLNDNKPFLRVHMTIRVPTTLRTRST